MTTNSILNFKETMVWTVAPLYIHVDQIYNRSFRGLGGDVFNPRTEDDDDKSKARMTENVFLALDNPSALVNEYLYGYREYMKGLTSLPTLHIGSGDEPISDDGSDECKRLFQRIRSESVKSMFLPETEIPQHADTGKLSVSSNNCKSPTAYTHQNHNQSNQLDLNEPSLSTATVLKHSQGMMESKSPKNVCKSMCEETFDESMSNTISPNISRDQAPRPNIKSPPGFPPVHGNKDAENIMKTDKPAENSKHVDHESSTQTKDVTTSSNTQHPPTKRETTGQQVLQSSESKKPETGTEQKPVDVTKKTYSGNRPQPHKSVPQISKQREPLKEKRLKDLSELRQQARSGGEGASVTKDQSAPGNARYIHCTLIFKEKVICVNRSYPSPSNTKAKPQFFFHTLFIFKFISVGLKNCFTKRLKEKTKIQKKSMYGIL